jgi:adenylosuccinate lyase
VEHGVSREDAYRLVQSHAMRAWREGLNFQQLVLADKEITEKVPRKKIEYAFDLQRQLKNVDKIFARVFQNKGARHTSPDAKKKSVRTRRGR